jgi:5-methylcytosine-specific restriction endonuclease McrA
MSMNVRAAAAQLSDDALLAKVKTLTDDSRQVTVELLVHLGELGVRKLYRGQGCSSLFRYCTDVLRLSESATNNRIKAARAARKFPVVLGMLERGSVSLTTIRLLAPHLTPENHEAVLAEATGMRRRQVDKLVARLAPKPDVPSSFRKLPAPSPASAPAVTLTTSDSTPSLGVVSAAVIPSAALPPPRPPVIEARSPQRYRVQFTVGEETEDQLRRLQDLLRAEIPDGDPGVIFARALPLLLREVEKRKFSATDRPRGGEPTGTSKPGSRHIPATVARAVWQRDGGQCAFIARNGRRCGERSFLEFHHVHAFALGGEATVENIALRCRAHNAYEAELIFGKYGESRVGEPAVTYGGTNRTSRTKWSRDQ